MAGAREREGAPRIGARRAILTAAAAAVLGAGAIALIGQVTSFGDLVDALRGADGVWLLPCLGGQLLAYAGYVLAYRDVARVACGPVLPLAVAVRIVAVGFGATVLGSAPGSLAVDFWALHRAGAGLHEAARRVLALNALEWLVLGGAASACGLFALAAGAGLPPAMTLTWPLLVGTLAVIALAVSTPGRAARLACAEANGPERPHGRDAGAWAAWGRDRARRALADAVGSVVLVRRLVFRPLRYPAGVLGFPVYWAGNVLTLGSALHAFGGGLSVPTLVLAYATGYVATALPLPAGGAGGIEAALAFGLHAAGAPLAPALAAVLVYRACTFWLPIVPALAVLPTLPRLGEDLAGTPRADRSDELTGGAERPLGANGLAGGEQLAAGGSRRVRRSSGRRPPRP